ncbi:MAG: acetate kinase [Brevinema sp.]
MKVLILNAGSSSLKYQLMETTDQSVLAKGVVEKIGLSDTFIGYENGSHPKIKKTFPCTNHKDAIAMMFDTLLKGDEAVLSSITEVNAIGHRVVHGGEVYSSSVQIDDTVMKTLRDLSDLAPLHNPANIMGIEACSAMLPNVPQVAVFDTAFHQTMPKESYIYGLPYEYYEKYRVRRYGFHGTSYAYVTQKAASFLNKKPEDINLIICHIGNGASVCAVQNGKSVDTSMGLTPLEGVVMGTRSGTIDPGAIFYLMEKENLTAADASNILNKKSGLLGVSGISSDMRDIEHAAYEQNHERALLARRLLANGLRKTIGSYFTVLKGKVDALCFTAGMGEYDPLLREETCEGLEFLGISMDKEVNAGVRGKLVNLSSKDAKIPALCVPTNEELMIALETERLVK